MAMRLAAVAIGCVAILACSGGHRAVDNASPAPAPADGVDLAKASLVMDDMRYSPSTLTIEAGQPLMLTVTNADDVPHEFIVRSKAKTIHLFLNPDKTIVSSFTIAKPGTYQFFCDVADHKERGMVGTLEVT